MVRVSFLARRPARRARTTSDRSTKRRRRFDPTGRTRRFRRVRGFLPGEPSRPARECRGSGETDFRDERGPTDERGSFHRTISCPGIGLA